MKTKKSAFTLEFPLRCSKPMLFEFVSTPNGLQEWFADKVDDKGNTFYFTWSGSTDSAEVVEVEENEFIRFRWDYYGDDEYFEFRISSSPITNETMLLITDFADKTDIKDQQQLWETQIGDLKSRLGC